MHSKSLVLGIQKNLIYFLKYSCNPVWVQFHVYPEKGLQSQITSEILIISSARDQKILLAARGSSQLKEGGLLPGGGELLGECSRGQPKGEGG